MPRIRTAALVVALSIQALFAESPVDVYLTEVKPVLKERCFACHGALKQKSGLRVDTVASMRAGDILDSGELLRRISANDLDDRMPPEGEPLKPAEIEAIQRWLTAGAPQPDGEVGEDDPSKHWAFQPIQRPKPPGVAGQNPIDAFIHREQSRISVAPQSESPRKLLLRRLSLDLTGLPPTPEFLNSKADYDSLVDRLLSSPQYGERWARRWMDIWRYSDSYGLGAQLRFSQKHLWHWRDWILESLNADKGYDQMIEEMLAGDEIAPEDPDIYRATGFLARNYYLFNRTTWLDATIEHTAKAFLGLTMNCAKCHDHKYDPISQVDYYQFRAFFEPHQVRLDPVPGEADFERDGIPRAFDNHLDIKTFLHVRGDPSNPDKDNELQPNIPEFFDFADIEIEEIPLPVYAWAPGTRPTYQNDRIAAARETVDQLKNASDSLTPLQSAELERARANLDRIQAIAAADNADYLGQGDVETAKANANQAERAWRIASARYNLEKLQAAEDAKPEDIKQAENQLKEVSESPPDAYPYKSLRGSRKALETPEHKESDYAATYPDKSAGRRSALADWIVHEDNPLTARVAVNHIWNTHFGQPLVDSVADFGRQAPKLQLAELLDYLAAYLIDHDWRMKPLHRLIVTSDTYKRGSSTLDADPDALKNDPNNQTYWRAPTRRMESQMVRDSLLALSGQLDPTLGGPTVDPTNPSNRRSLYFRHSRDDKHQFLQRFDDADIFQCYRRKESIAPQQALALSNSRLAIDSAEAIAENLRSLQDSEFIQSAWELILGRLIEPDELDACRAFLQEFPAPPDAQSSSPTDETQTRARTRLVHSLLNHNDFITIR